MRGHGVLLTEPIAAADRLVVGLVAVGHADEHHVVGVLEVHAEPCDGGLRDEHAYAPVLKRLELFDLLLGISRTFDVHGVGYGGGDGVGFVVESAPDDPLVVVSGDQFDGPCGAGFEGLAAHLRSATDTTEVGGEQLPFGHDVDGYDLRDDRQLREVVSGVGPSEVRWAAQRDGPLRHPFVHRADGVVLDAPADLVVHEERGEHLGAGHDAKELGMVAEFGDVVRGGGRGAREAGRNVGPLFGEPLPGAALNVLQDAGLVEDDGTERVGVELVGHLVVRDVDAGPVDLAG